MTLTAKKVWKQGSSPSLPDPKAHAPNHCTLLWPVILRVTQPWDRPHQWPSDPTQPQRRNLRIHKCFRLKKKKKNPHLIVTSQMSLRNSAWLTVKVLVKIQILDGALDSEKPEKWGRNENEGLRENPPIEYPLNCGILSLGNWGVYSLDKLKSPNKTLTDTGI